MVAEIRPEWRVETVDRSPHGTDFVAHLDVATPDGDRRVVLKATTADLVDPRVARAEPRLLALVDRETTVPVPTVYGYRDAHPDLPAPFTLMAHVDGATLEGESHALPRAVMERVCRDAGRNLAALHGLGTFECAGQVGVRDGSLAVLDTDEDPRYDRFHDRLLDHARDAIDSLDTGGYFPDYADDPERFADLQSILREYVERTIPALPAPGPSAYDHWDYRLGNLLVDPDTGATRAVLDWANLAVAPPAANLAAAESHLLDPQRVPADRTRHCRDALRSAYADARDDWTFDAEVRERMRAYRVGERIGAMACLPLWHQDASEGEKTEREREHRGFLAEHVDAA
jgi:aminoglycoside phosphotransferase (APT) family kinase protein